MIEEVVNSILEAEDVAKAKIAEAQKKAGEIVAVAETEVEQIRRQSAEKNKALFAEKMKQADVSAESVAKSKLAQANAETDAEMAVYGKNTDKAVKIILESL